MAKGGGSQLSKLKSRLHSDGITDRRQQSSKKKKRSSISKTSTSSSKEDASVRASKLASIASSSSFNPFEQRTIKPKHQTFASNPKKLSSTKPGISRSASLNSRKETLEPEYKDRFKSGGIVDRRFGEGDMSLNPEEKMLERFKKERLRQSNRMGKMEVFNLNDDEEKGEMDLTHFGMSLDGLDRFDDVGLGENDDFNIDKRTTDRNHFGGFNEKEGEDGEAEDEEDHPKSKAEVMREVMAKSKLAKYERQQVKTADDEIRMELDDELGDIRGLLFNMENEKDEEEEEVEKKGKGGKYGDPNMTGPNAKPMAENKWGKKEEKKDEENQEDEGNEDEEEGGEKVKGSLMAALGLKPSSDEKEGTKDEDTYDSYVRSLAFERRAKPTDRLKTEEEIAKEEAETLRKSEIGRLKRMRGEEDDDEDGVDGKKKRKGKKGKGLKNRIPQADDLEDDFDDGQEGYGLGTGLEGKEDESDEDDDEEEEEGDDEEEEGESGDDEEEGENVEDIALPGTSFSNEKVFDQDLSDTEENLAPTKKSSKTGLESKSKSKRKALPFTFPCPKNHDEFLEILTSNEVRSEEIPTVIKRIKTLHHPSLGEENKFKLQAFLGVLLDHVLFIGAGLKGQVEFEEDDNEESGGLNLINLIIPEIFNLSKTYPIASSQHFVSKLSLMQRNLTRGLSRGALNPNSRTWPLSSELILFKTISLIFSTSDSIHPVCTPTNLLISQYLAHCRIRNLKDLSSCLFLCGLVVGDEKESKRIRPEALNALHCCLVLLIDWNKDGKKEVKNISERFGIPMMDFGEKTTRNLSIKGEIKEEVIEEKPNLFKMLNFNSDTSSSEDFQESKLSLLRISISLIEDFSKLYKGGSSYIELFTPFSSLLSLIPTSTNLSFSTTSSLSTLHSQVLHHLSSQLSLSSSTRRALRLQAHRSLALPSHIPKFEQQGYNPRKGSGMDPDSQRVEAQKLRALLKKEKKGAVRELRKDNQFIANLKEQNRKVEDGEYKKKMDKVVKGLQDERHEQKKLDQEKVRLKKKSGR